MNWFYAHQGARAGPVDDEGLSQLVALGTVTPETLVWSSGMAAWKPYAEVLPARPAAAPPVSESGAFAGTYPAQCSQCGGIFPASDMVRLEGLNSCAGCKPLLLQKMRQGVPPRLGAYGLPQLRFAGFWIRLGARILDGLILLPLSLTLLFVLVNGHYLTPARSGLFLGQPSFGFSLPQWIGYAIEAIFSMVCVGRFGGTPGKLICGLRIVRADGSRVSYLRALGRFCASLLNILTLDFSYLLVAFDPEKRGLHDRIAGTRVVYK